MKKHFFATMLLAAMSGLAIAQDSPETAIDLRVGYNEYTPDTKEEVDVYWKYTAEENSILTIEVTSIQQLEAFELEGNERVPVKPAQSEFYITQNFPLKAGSTIYFKIPVYDGNKAKFDLKTTSFPELGKGLEENDPMPISPGRKYYMGNQYVFSDQVFYATYTADKEGLLVMTAPTAVMGIAVEGSIGLRFDPTFAIDRGSQHQCKMPVEEGKTYLIRFDNYSPFILDITFEDAERGSLYMPFRLKEGDNTVPAAAGTYYYIYSNERTGYGVVSSTSELPGGQVKIFPEDKSLVEAGYTLATSEEGSFNTRWELEEPNTIYFVCVNKTEATAEEQIMTFACEDYKAGDKESNPIVISEIPSEITTEASNKTTFYAVDVPAQSNKILDVKAVSEIQSGYTKVEIYLEGNSYNTVSDNKAVYTQVSGGEQGQRYIIKWTSSETEPITFKVSMEDIMQGDIITDPITAVKGENTVENKNGYIKYYKYTATITGKLYFSGPSNMFVSFPKGTGPYDGSYSTTRDENMAYVLEILEGTTYLIKIDGALDGQKFTIEEKEYDLGEGRTNPIIVDGDTYTFGDEVPSNLWLQYTMKKDGVLTIESDKPYNTMGYDEIYYCKGKDGEPVAISRPYFDGTTASTIYYVDLSAAAGDIFLVNVKITTASKGNSVTFTEREFKEGESVNTAIELKDGEAVELPEVEATKPLWYVVPLEEGEVTVTTNAPFMTNPVWFANEEDALNGTNGVVMEFQNSFDEDYNMLCTWKTTVTTPGKHYIRVDEAYTGISMTLTGPVSTNIYQMNDMQEGITAGKGYINVSAANKPVAIYNVSGVKVAESNVDGNCIFNLNNGIYIVKVGNLVKKVLVK